MVIDIILITLASCAFVVVFAFWVWTIGGLLNDLMKNKLFKFFNK